MGCTARVKAPGWRTSGNVSTDPQIDLSPSKGRASAPIARALRLAAGVGGGAASADDPGPAARVAGRCDDRRLDRCRFSPRRGLHHGVCPARLARRALLVGAAELDMRGDTVSRRQARPHPERVASGTIRRTADDGLGDLGGRAPAKPRRNGPDADGRRQGRDRRVRVDAGLRTVRPFRRYVGSLPTARSDNRSHRDGNARASPPPVLKPPVPPSPPPMVTPLPGALVLLLGAFGLLGVARWRGMT